MTLRRRKVNPISEIPQCIESEVDQLGQDRYTYTSLSNITGLTSKLPATMILLKKFYFSA